MKNATYLTLFKRNFLSDEIIIQGPPGTGKTYQMAKLIADLLDKNKVYLPLH